MILRGSLDCCSLGIAEAALGASIAYAKERIAFGPLSTPKVIDIFVTGYLDDIDKPDSMIYGVTWWTTGDRKSARTSRMRSAICRAIWWSP